MYLQCATMQRFGSRPRLEFTRAVVCMCECVCTYVLPGIKAESILPIVHKWTADF